MGRLTAVNDVAIHRKVGERVAQIAYALDGEEVGSVRCDGLVVATPAGSTGYNLANGGPVMAWGWRGLWCRSSRPTRLRRARWWLRHATGCRSTTARESRSTWRSMGGRRRDPTGEAIDARFVDAAGTIAQLPGSSFYRRLREKFGRLAS